MTTTIAAAPADKVYDPLDADVKHNPYPYYAKLRRDEPVKWLPNLNAYSVARYDDVEAVLKNGRLFSSARFWPELRGEYDPVPEALPMISMDPPGHVQLRKLANKAFVPAKIGALQARTVAIANALIDDVIAEHGTEGEFDFVWQFTALYPVTVIAEVLGVGTERRAEFKHWVDDLLSAANRAGYDVTRLAQIRSSSDHLRAYFEEIYDERCARPGDDLISSFIAAEVDGQRLSRNDVLTMAIMLLLGGVETTTNLLGTTLVELNRHPEVHARVRGDPALIPALIEEVLRYNPPVQIVFRHTTEDTMLGGVDVPAGASIMPLLASANRDETRFDAPERFDIDRRNAAQIMSFGQGPHFCLGSYLTRMESRSALEILFRRFATLLPLSPDVTWMDSYFARGPQSLAVAFRHAA